MSTTMTEPRELFLHEMVPCATRGSAARGAERVRRRGSAVVVLVVGERQAHPLDRLAQQP